MEFFKKTTWREKILFLTAMIVCGVSVAGVVLFDRLFYRPYIDPADIIAKITFTLNSVRRHTPFQFEFSAIANVDPVGNGDTIFSGPGASAQLTFKEGSTLTIGPDSLVVVRIRDGKIEVKIDRGEVSGKLKDKTQIEIQSEEEAVILTGDKDTEFKLSYLPKMGLEMKRYQKTASALPSPEEAVAQNGVFKPSDNKDATATDKPDAVPPSSKQEIPSVKVKGFKIDETVKMMPKKYTLKTPAPADNSLIFHKSGFQLAVFPKPTCSDKCNLDIYLDGKKYYARDFDPHNVPIVYMNIAKDAAGKLSWILKDGGAETKGQFELRQYSERDFADAMKEKRSIEIAD